MKLKRKKKKRKRPNLEIPLTGLNEGINSFK